MRKQDFVRTTKETNIKGSICLDGSGNCVCDSGCGFLNHMLELFAAHGKFDLELSCRGDTDVDYHHTTEDIGIALGEAIKNALGEKRGIRRYGSFLLPMDEALVLCALDISGRTHLSYDVTIPTQKVGDFDTELVQEFFEALCRSMGLTLHIKQLSGCNSHHIIEAVFKGFARALAEAVSIDEAFRDKIPSTKGVL